MNKSSFINIKTRNQKAALGQLCLPFSFGTRYPYLRCIWILTLTYYIN